jgi:hypothetical protein
MEEHGGLPSFVRDEGHGVLCANGARSSSGALGAGNSNSISATGTGVGATR